jgi:hypothetical protein
LKWDAKDSLPEQAIATASATNTVVHVNFASSGNFAQKCKIRLAVSPRAKPPVDAPPLRPPLGMDQGAQSGEHRGAAGAEREVELSERGYR